MEAGMTTKAQRWDGCCRPVTAGVLDEVDATELASVFKVLADPVRLRLLSMVASAPTGEACACDLVEPLGRSQPTVSHHLSALVEAVRCVEPSSPLLRCEPSEAPTSVV
jgi:hypothetical protein